MKIETTKMSSRGQVVIPQNLRKEIEANEGTIFIVMANGDSLILKKVDTPSREDILRNLDIMAKEGEKRAEELGIKEKDIPSMVQRFRKLKHTKK